MRWNLRDSMPPVVGEIRERRGFLWLPLCVGDECRWLERARWLEKYDLRDARAHRDWQYGWAPIKFIDTDEENDHAG